MRFRMTEKKRAALQFQNLSFLSAYGNLKECCTIFQPYGVRDLPVNLLFRFNVPVDDTLRVHML